MRILLLADIHIGCIKDIPYFYNVMTDIIEKEIVFAKTDAVVILGDYFDRLFKVNEEYVSLTINTMSYLVRACSKNKTKIRIVYGTESHEMDQYKLFNYHFTSKKVDIKLFTTAEEEELFPGVNVLYLPEEYISDKHEFYKDTLYSGKQYKYIFGHGVIEDGMPAAVSFGHSANNTEKQVPRFKSGELSAASEVAVFGHYHVHTTMEGNVHYVGSLFRHSFGEEEPKGYGIITDDQFSFVENKEAYIYKTYEFDSTSSVYNNPDDLIREIEAIKNENPELFKGVHYGRIRIIYHPPEDCDISFKDTLKSVLFNDKIISPLIKEENTRIIEDAKDEVEDEYEFVLDNSMKITDKIHTFITKQYDEPMSLEELLSYINDPLTV